MVPLAPSSASQVTTPLASVARALVLLQLRTLSILTPPFKTLIPPEVTMPPVKVEEAAAVWLRAATFRPPAMVEEP